MSTSDAPLSARPLKSVRYEHRGTPLVAYEEGQGTPLVMLHGGLGNHLAVRLELAPLATRLRLVTPDVRAAGASVFHGELSWRLLADDVAALLDALGLERAVVGGSSAGAAVACRFALDHGDRLAGLVLLRPAFGGAELGVNPAQHQAFQAMLAAAQCCVDEGMSALHPLFSRLPEPIRSRSLAIVDGYDPRSVVATTRFLASEAQPFERLAELATITAPALVVTGADPEHPAQVAERIAAALPSATLAPPTASSAPAVAHFVASLRRG